MKNKILFICVVLSFVSIQVFGQKSGKKYSIRTVAFYNLENLFDTINNPDTYDDDRTPTGKDQYTSKVYWDKIDNLAQVISEIGTDKDKNGPVILGVSELETEGVLQDLVNNERIKKKNYGIIHFDSPDKRGVDVALLYQKKYFSPVDYKSYELKLWSDNGRRIYTRDQLMVKGYLDDELVYVIVNHWPSRRGGEKRSSPLREKAAALTKKIVDEILEEDDDAKIMIMGDFNDDPTNKSIKDILDAKRSKNVEDEELYNPFYNMFESGMSSLGYRDNINLFDQIIISGELLTDDKDYDDYKFYEAHIFNPSYLTNSKGRYKGYPFRSYSNNQYTGGYSDHYPVYIYLIREMGGDNDDDD
ncbi:endonuclease/exonuclease/phosphatase family protein [Aureivirga sp. CE67]|uniref:endonuclease/exonuclease/phosphatase family protein n=1 Tax=Aureivirga sp. CE67 TaxID=1788983 RepID=UPI0018CBB806|nr:endonuclease/exonuclease/phosphatase family protein [Aureivirga sp. CE67]